MFVDAMISQSERWERGGFLRRAASSAHQLIEYYRSLHTKELHEDRHVKYLKPYCTLVQISYTRGLAQTLFLVACTPSVPGCIQYCAVPQFQAAILKQPYS
jgi:hypothetical protein